MRRRRAGMRGCGGRDGRARRRAPPAALGHPRAWLRPRRRHEPVRRLRLRKHGGTTTRSSSTTTATPASATADGRSRCSSPRATARSASATPHKACGKRLHRGAVRLRESGLRVILESGRGRRITTCGRSGTAKGGHGIQVGGKGTYRGKLMAKASGGLLVVNKVSLDDYTRGVVANEMPSSWPQNALRAQAVAARSYRALPRRARASTSTTTPVARCTPARDRRPRAPIEPSARRATRSSATTSRPSWPSSSRPRAVQTESNQFAFGSSPIPYLQSVKDPYDNISPYHTWTVHESQGEMESALSGLFSGRLKKVKVTKTGDSPRIVKAKVVGSKGSSSVSGATLQGRLGLMSTWARFHRH